MNASGIRVEDIVRCDVRGDLFFAQVEQPVEEIQCLGKRALTVNSLTGRPIPTRYITPRQIVGHWRKAGRRS